MSDRSKLAKLAKLVNAVRNMSDGGQLECESAESASGAKQIDWTLMSSSYALIDSLDLDANAATRVV